MARNRDMSSQLRNQFKTGSNRTDKNIEKTIKELDTDISVSNSDNTMSSKKSSEEFITIRKGGRPPIGDESRSKKITVLLTPSLYEDLRESAYLKRVSVNEFIFSLIDKNVVKQNKKK